MPSSLMVVILLCLMHPASAQNELIYGKYYYKTEVGNANIKYSYYTEHKLELRVDSQYVLEKYIYHTSKPGLKSGFELVESSKSRGYWKVEKDILFLRRISMLIELKENHLIEPNWVKLDIRKWTRKKRYFIFRKKPKIQAQ